MARFTVDTHLFRELGELLVGRDSTALIELIKNAYDADATRVSVYGQRLDSPEHGAIVVTDDGVGMTEEQFTSGFLRVASRFKDQGDRRSLRYGRRYTGVKGIGRLAAHKLARMLEIESVRAEVDKGTLGKSLHAVIDWDAIERHQTLDDLHDNIVALEVGPSRDRSGTTLTLSNLRRAWGSVERARFFSEVHAFEPAPFLQVPLTRPVADGPLLFETPFVRDVDHDRHPTIGDFQVALEGDFAVGEEYWELVAGVASWVLEIRAQPGEKVVRFAIAPTRRTATENPAARKFNTEIPHPDPDHGPFFDARVLVREGRFKTTRDQRVWASRSSGIRVYLEGFRVLPYGDDDWLAIDADYTRRSRTFELLQDLDLNVEVDGIDPDEGLIRVPANNYFGGVFLTQERAPTLRILVNREGFVPEAGFDTLVKLMRTGVDLCTRVRAAAAYPQRQQRKQERKRASTRTDSGAEGRPTVSLPALLGDAVALSQRARSLVGEGELESARQVVMDIERILDRTKGRATEVMSEQSLLRVLASVGAQMAAFVHEVNTLLGAAQTVEQAIERTIGDEGHLRVGRQRTLRRTLAAATDLRRGLERHASYLVDVVTPDARRRRSRQRLADRFDGAVRLVQHQADRRGIEIENGIAAEVQSPPMFPAELTTVFANLLTNAVKAVGKGGRVRASVAESENGLHVRIQNTGSAVDVENGERWFRPFESTTWEVDPVLGQGMGLGLTITRNVLASYGATIGFVEPDSPFSTAVEIVFTK